MVNAARRTPPAWVRWTLVGVLALVASLGFGVLTASADLSLGPHEARYEITTSGEVAADLGPLGTLRVDSPAGPLGVDVTIREIPADLAQIDRSTTLEDLSVDLQSYLQFFASPDVTIREVTSALVVDAVRRTAVALVVLAVAGAGLWFLVGAVRRRELAARVAPRTWEVAAGVAVLALLAGTLVADDRETPSNTPTSPVFAGTAFEGARITGRLAGVIDTYGAQLLGIYRSNEEFYADARTSLQEAWDRQARVDVALARMRERSLTTLTGTTAQPSDAATSDAATADVATPDAATPDAATPDPATPDPATPDAATPDPATPDPAASASPSAPAASGTPTPDVSPSGEPSAEVSTPSPTPEEDLVTLLVVSDLHCNMSMTPLIRDVAANAGAAAILDAGDTTMNGTAVERVCVNSFASARPQGVEMIAADGNHDSQVIADAQRGQGITVLEGSVVEVDGVRILGDRDPHETRVGGGTSVREETLEEVGERLAATACEDDVDLLLIHTPAVGNAALESGCVPFQVSGHTHRRHDPFAFGLGLRYVNGSTAGAASGQPTVGPLHGTAEMTLLRFDPVARRFVDWKLVEVFPDATAQVSPWQEMPAAPEPVEVEDGEGDGDRDDQTGDEQPTPGDEQPSGDAESSDAESGDAESGDAESGDAESGDAGSGDDAQPSDDEPAADGDHPADGDQPADDAADASQP
ncbi:metallophosphoesterase [Xylanimonas cellulosilytica DSM 15894]|uniref:Metallophosphoesterase n=1 Tax=Xylanimonas cellulosilytica (strain DSM 15894 / JCM 12276 / CECT 5975 / KCTC 9989 / LMG 20990 / NBRC 107835 / XIL07) TaxID=446471 RepID=D1BV06_XYLCX|nr:metallophosphoesterase family protein [Xylanimonas cellulosilytica]ACZ31245.1 metallophosphoesterase [Xylanimonas cellulosilytica DSM 15894]